MFTFLGERWKELFAADFEVLLYDLTSTYFECDPPADGKRRLQPRQAFRLRASRDRADRHAGWFSIGLRSHGRQHLGQDDTEGVPGQDRKAIWQGQAHLGDGSWHCDRGSVGRDAKFKNADPLSGRLAPRATHATREGVFDETVGERARERAGQTDRTRGRDI